MAARLSDTHPDAERKQIEALRRMSAGRRIELVSQLTIATRQMALAGLRKRFPQASDQELHRRLATLCLGPELASKVYGPEPDPPTMR
jgi:hypothetical protein